MLVKSYVNLLFVVAACVFDAVFGTLGKGCLLNVTNESTEKFLPVPLYNLSSHYELVVPYKGAISLNHGAKIILICPGSRNYLTLTNSNITSASCVETNKVQIFHNKTNFEDIQCKKIVKGEVLETDERCGNNEGCVYKIGYQVTKKDWVTLIDVCYVPEIGSTLYTQHVIYGKSMKYASKATYRPGFSTAGLNNDVTASVAYKKPFQKATFSKILKSASLAENYINSKSYLARGHLSPHADFLLATAQYTTYYYVNTAPQWQGINSGSWKSIESMVRKLSQSYEKLEIFTGTHDVLTYQDIYGNTEPIFLVSGTRLPVRKYFWKIVYDPNSEKAITFVIINDPYISKVNDIHIFCEDICVDNGYTNAAWRKIDSGYVFCCAVNNFQNVVNTVPRLRVKGILGI